MSAKTVQVGTCGNLKAEHTFTTIQAAVNHSPAGTTILVCPGIYPEQVVIDKALTIKGVGGNGTSSGAVIASPAGGLVGNTTSLTSGRLTAAQVVVTETADVNLSNLTIDGNDNKIDGCSLPLVGLLFRNASGEISHVVVQNHAITSGFVLCGSGLAIYVQSGNGGTSTVSIKDSHIQNYQKNGITANGPGTSVHIERNTVVGRGNNGESETSLQNSIQIGFGAKAKIIENTVMDDVYGPTVINNSGEGAVGILVFASEGVVIAGNTIGNTQFGIALFSDDIFGSAAGATITGNKVTTTRNYDAIEICSSSNRVHHNVINGSDEAGIRLDAEEDCGEVEGNQISDNTISGACAGILMETPAGANNIGDNTFFNVRNTVLPAEVCPAPQGLLHASALVSGGQSSLRPSAGSSGGRKPQPVRP
ncbi:MAG TPA: right-handed parallel beta-helix repeat-containing protein [Candidatus Angelobacter sp.]